MNETTDYKVYKILTVYASRIRNGFYRKHNADISINEIARQCIADLSKALENNKDVKN